jgi:threonine dehydratase
MTQLGTSTLVEAKAENPPRALRDVIKRTTIMESDRLSARLGLHLTLASETFQHTGSFKFRAAYHLAATVPNRKLIAASSGNFGQALAYACQLLGKSCIVVMPETSARVKIEAVRSYGAEVDLIDTRSIGRAERIVELEREFPEAYSTNAYDDLLIIEGNASLGEELLALDRDFDSIVVPIGGGGLSSGIISGLRRAGNHTPVIGAEPLIANDAARSLRAGRIISNEGEPPTIADGARTVSLGKHNWEILQHGLEGIVEVSEESIKEAVRLLFDLTNLKAEPTGALSVGALLTQPEKFQDKRVCCVISGGNVDAEVYRNLLA